MQRSRSLFLTLTLTLIVLITSANALAQKFEVGGYAGGTFFSSPSFLSTARNVNPPFQERIQYGMPDGGVIGIRARENLWEHFGLEQSWTITGTNNMVFPTFVVGSRLQQLYFNGNINARSSEDSFRPYFSGGIGWNFYIPTDDGKVEAVTTDPAFLAPFGNPIGTSSTFAWNAGVGFNWKVFRRLKLDFSVRDFVYYSPTLDFPEPSARDYDNNLQVMGGVMFGFGGGGPVIVHNFTVAPSIEATSTSLCPGEPTTLRVNASDSLPNNQVTYRWTVNGQEVGMDPQYTFIAPTAGGPYDVGVRVFYNTANLDKPELKAVEKNPGVPADRKVTVMVRNYAPPTAIATLDRSSIQRGERVHATATATGSECSGNLAYRWGANDGRLISGPDTKSTDLDSSNLAFLDSVREQQCRPVKISLEVTDQRGGTAMDEKYVQVCYTAPPVTSVTPPPVANAIQLADINFGRNSGRVNNCAKRVLANELYPQLTDSRYRDFDVLLVGHRDASEAQKATRQSVLSLDRERALNAAGFLSGKGATCKDIESTRIKVAWTDTNQHSDYRSNFCDASTVERRGSAATAADDKAKNRRVEVWLVPKGATLPAELGNIQDFTYDASNRQCSD